MITTTLLMENYYLLLLLTIINMFSSQRVKQTSYWESSGEEDGATGLGFVRTVDFEPSIG